MSKLSTWITEKLLRKNVLRWSAQKDGRATEWVRHSSFRMMFYGQILNRTVAPPNLDTLPVREVQDYIKALNTRNKAMGGPVKIQGNVHEMSFVDWLEVERQLNLSTIRSAHTTIAIEYHTMATVLPEKTSFMLFPKSDLSLLYRAFNFGIIGAGFFALFSILQRVPMVLAVLTVGLAIGLTVREVLSKLLNNGGHLNYFENSLSTTWDDVFTKTTEGNLLLVTLLAKFVEMWPAHDTPIPEFYEWTPAQTLRFITYAMTEDHQLSTKVKDEAVALIKSYVTSGNVNVKRSAVYHQLDVSSFGDEHETEASTKKPAINLSKAVGVYQALTKHIGQRER